MGSSPLARGGPAWGRPQRRGAGLIPARAGRTRRTSVRAAPPAAHPRSRGADRPVRPGAGRRSGSSPLARGGRTSQAPFSAIVGLIPARAGRTVPDLQRYGPPEWPYFTFRWIAATWMPCSSRGEPHRRCPGLRVGAPSATRRGPPAPSRADERGRRDLAQSARTRPSQPDHPCTTRSLCPRVHRARDEATLPRRHQAKSRGAIW